MTIRADIFCKVIDNFGDLGVCWRLARQLTREHGVAVTLWVDDLHSFARMAPGLEADSPQQYLDDIDVRFWQGDIMAPSPGDLVIEGFGCPLPTGFLEAMAARAQPPVWLNLEYLSAEGWVEDCHGLPSQHPQYRLTQHFWFPGFTARTGGLLREADLLVRRDQFQADQGEQQVFWTRIGIPDALSHDRRLSLFAYENPAIPAWLQAMAEGQASTLVVVPTGRALTDVARWAGREVLVPGDRLHSGQLTVVVLPFLSHEDYDHLLWASDLNAVRGEDSFVRAQWAGRPLLWHIYPQEENAHWVKLEAFVALLEHHDAMPALWAEAMRAWNRGDAAPDAWTAFAGGMGICSAPARAWSEHLATQQDLATSVMRFYASQVE